MTDPPADPRAVAVLGALAKHAADPETQLKTLGYVAGLIATRAQVDGVLSQDDARMDLEAGFDRGQFEIIEAEGDEGEPRGIRKLIMELGPSADSLAEPLFDVLGDQPAPFSVQLETLGYLTGFVAAHVAIERAPRGPIDRELVESEALRFATVYAQEGFHKGVRDAIHSEVGPKLRVLRGGA